MPVRADVYRRVVSSVFSTVVEIDNALHRASSTQGAFSMPRSISTAFLPRRQIATVFVSGLLGFAALLAMVPASASAAGPTTCDAREFCIGRGHHLSGGLYQNPENDNTFVDNVFLPSGGHVENNHRSVYNHGKAQSNGYHDVIIYSERDWDGDSACITLGRLLPDLFVISVEQNDTAWYEDWTNEIKSFKWATHAQCTPHGVLIND